MATLLTLLKRSNWTHWTL